MSLDKHVGKSDRKARRSSNASRTEIIALRPLSVGPSHAMRKVSRKQYSKQQRVSANLLHIKQIDRSSLASGSLTRAKYVLSSESLLRSSESSGTNSALSNECVASGSRAKEGARKKINQVVSESSLTLSLPKDITTSWLERDTVQASESDAKGRQRPPLWDPGSKTTAKSIFSTRSLTGENRRNSAPFASGLTALDILSRPSERPAEATLETSDCEDVHLFQSLDASRHTQSEFRSVPSKLRSTKDALSDTRLQEELSDTSSASGQRSLGEHAVSESGKVCSCKHPVLLSLTTDPKWEPTPSIKTPLQSSRNVADTSKSDAKYPGYISRKSWSAEALPADTFLPGKEDSNELVITRDAKPHSTLTLFKRSSGENNGCSVARLTIDDMRNERKTIAAEHADIMVHDSLNLLRTKSRASGTRVLKVPVKDAGTATTDVRTVPSQSRLLPPDMLESKRDKFTQSSIPQLSVMAVASDTPDGEKVRCNAKEYKAEFPAPTESSAVQTKADDEPPRNFTRNVAVQSSAPAASKASLHSETTDTFRTAQENIETEKLLQSTGTSRPAGKMTWTAPGRRHNDFTLDNPVEGVTETHLSDSRGFQPSLTTETCRRANELSSVLETSVGAFSIEEEKRPRKFAPSNDGHLILRLTSSTPPVREDDVPTVLSFSVDDLRESPHMKSDEDDMEDGILLSKLLEYVEEKADSSLERSEPGELINLGRQGQLPNLDSSRDQHLPQQSSVADCHVPEVCQIVDLSVLRSLSQPVLSTALVPLLASTEIVPMYSQERLHDGIPVTLRQNRAVVELDMTPVVAPQGGVQPSKRNLALDGSGKLRRGTRHKEQQLVLRTASHTVLERTRNGLDTAAPVIAFSFAVLALVAAAAILLQRGQQVSDM
ncbi:uncharacterized protein LOC135370236 isoform X2 [Ornithodoros turicata]|uniref:uncharacterized protein LOC135370236 isoform X2 n=1 Tax=Ornithodoros turicata TaxID=34597 RepID=UPI003139A478